MNQISDYFANVLVDDSADVIAEHLDDPDALREIIGTWIEDDMSTIFEALSESEGTNAVWKLIEEVQDCLDLGKITNDCIAIVRHSQSLNPLMH